MPFTSIKFLIFFPAVCILYYLTPSRWRWVTLLLGSWFFYLNLKPVYLFLLVIISVSTYVFTNLTAKTTSESAKRLYTTINIILILLPLLFYKYFPIINSSLIELLKDAHLHWPLPEIKLILPVGISFYTFMAIGYTLDVYNEKLAAETKIGPVALFISFFPLLLSGPIERADKMLPQFRKFNPINFTDISEGLKLMLWGYFLKLVVADRIGIYTDVIYGNITGNNGTSLLIASVLYPFQVYADLGGYSLIAIGSAKVLGINVMQNFRRPFFATSMAEFWRRWHISLISWLTDYVYTPLSFRFRKFKIWGIVIALLLTFILSGVWHGASWTFVIWGLMQGIFLSIEAYLKFRGAGSGRQQRNRPGSFHLFLGSLLTFVLFAGSQIIGRSPDLSSALMVFRKILSDQGSPYLDLTTLVLSFLGLVIVMLKDFKDEFYHDKLRIFSNQRPWVRYGSYLIVFFMIMLLGVFNGTRFIYFQF